MNRNVLFLSVVAMMAVGCGDDSTSRRDTGVVQRDAARPDTPGIDQGPECVLAAAENTTALCNDGCDNDGDLFIDGDDDECDLPCPAVEENTLEACSDGCDNDGNSFADCGYPDREIRADNACIAFCPQEANNLTCSDGIDNDNNGFIDCMDFSCSPTRDRDMNPIPLNVCVRESNNAGCSDGMDNDGDGDIDCDDSDCSAENIVVCDGGTVPTRDMWPALVAAKCTDGEDNDENTFTDCGDFGCQYEFITDVCWDLPRENSNAACSDGIDNDGDGEADCDDTGCTRSQSVVVCSEGSPVILTDEEITTAANARCDDGDANGGTRIDCEDFACRFDTFVTVCENPESASDATCMDGIDNDDNGFMDCGDFACSRNPNITVCPTESTSAECGDGMDNDGNGFVDCRDFSCSDTAICRNQDS